MLKTMSYLDDDQYGFFCDIENDQYEENKKNDNEPQKPSNLPSSNPQSPPKSILKKNKIARYYENNPNCNENDYYKRNENCIEFTSFVCINCFFTCILYTVVVMK